MSLSPTGASVNRASGAPLKLRTPAKINLFLEVLGRRATGYHDIVSVMTPVSLYDEIKLEAADEGIATRTVFGNGEHVDPRGLLDTAHNLADRAAAALKARTGHAGGVRIALTKNIPVGGGLGGGSADAAAVLIGLNELWGAGLAPETLMEIGAGLGCDVPGLVRGGPVLVEGLGERVRPLPVDKPGRNGWWVVIANPGFPVATRDIYSRCCPPLTSRRSSANSIASALREGDLERVADGVYNGLQDTVFRKYPLIQMLAEKLTACGACAALLSGSGASVFGLARDEGHALEIRQATAAWLPETAWTAVARTLPDGVTVAHGPLEA
ncbi:MAG: 4-(cytidine 5'-diphospho)-2-C-methyl-D-erythritol kinase [Lentisphaerae bacterium]|nr:4-(cytidine 5'-diphospho)-2-C-methyl-D-erythritol kinase [Lentisphaerota bacterium]